LVMKDAPYDKFVILEYKVKNSATSTLSNFYFGIFSDWDITTNGQQDAADWDNSNKMGYVYPAKTAAKPYAGIQLLTGSPAYYAIDNDSAIAGNPWGLYYKTTGNFSDAHKFQTISATIGSGNERLKAGVLTSGGADVSHVVSSGPYTIASGQTITIAFALHAAANFSDLQTSARYADSLYNYTMQASKPLANPDTICYNAQTTLNASGANSINWYNTFTGGQSFFNGTQYITGNLKSDTAFYVSNADHSYESVRTPINVKVKANPKIFTSGSTTICQGDTVKLSVAQADSTIWNTGQKTNTIKAYAAGKYAVLSKDNSLTCVSKSDTVHVIVNAKPTAGFSVSSDLRTQIPISFTDQSTGAVTWFWDFGDGQNSSAQNPVHTYAAPSNTVKLTVTAADGCTDTKTNSVAVITAVEEPQTLDIKIYPNPVGAQDVQIIIDSDHLNHSTLVIANSLGQVILDREISTDQTHLELSVPSASWGDGLNILKFNMDGKTAVRKLIKVR
jgi:serine protease